MIEARMTDLNYNEILRYLGCRGQEVSPEMEARIRRSAREMKGRASPGLVFARLPLEGGEILGFPAEGEDIRDLLLPCAEAVLLAATLGAGVDRELMRRGVTDMADALILDACASVAIENVCDCFEEDMRRQLAGEGLSLTARFSPGYGDFPVETQGRMCEALNTIRRIGLGVTKDSVMMPRKSITAILGVSERPQGENGRGCGACGMSSDCPYKKRGAACE